MLQHTQTEVEQWDETWEVFNDETIDENCFSCSCSSVLTTDVIVISWFICL